MKYSVDKEKFFALLRIRPALVKTVVNLTEEDCIDFFTQNYNSVSYGLSGICINFYLNLPQALQTLAVTRKYIRAVKEGRFDLGPVPKEVLAQFTKNDRKICIKAMPESVEELPNVTAEEWLLAVSEGYSNFETIPEKLITADMVIAALRNDEDFNSNLPARLWSNEFALELVRVSPSAICMIPKDLITNEILKLCLAKINDEIKIPDSAWDQATAEAAVVIEDCENNIELIPKQFKTEQVNILAARNHANFKDLNVKTYPVIVAHTTYGNNSYWSGHDENSYKRIRKIIKGKETQFIWDVLQEANIDCASVANDLLLFKIGLTISNDLWLEILKKYPGCIARIPKSDQTPEMVDAFLSAASPELIDKYSEIINLMRVREHHAPLLMGCKKAVWQEIRNKYFLAGSVHAPAKGMLEIDMAPTMYAKIRKELYDEKD
jgi:hypothetical protein